MDSDQIIAGKDVEIANLREENARLKQELHDARGRLGPEVLRGDIAEMELRRWYLPDGSTEFLQSAEKVTARRKSAAVVLDRAKDRVCYEAISRAYYDAKGLLSQAAPGRGYDVAEARAKALLSLLEAIDAYRIVAAVTGVGATAENEAAP